MANKIIALHELVHSLLAVTAVMKDALSRGHIDAQQYVETKGNRNSRRIKYQSSVSHGSLEDGETPVVEGLATVEAKKTTDLSKGDTDDGTKATEPDSSMFTDEAPSDMDDTSTSSSNDSVTVTAISDKPTTTATTKVVKAPNNTRVAVSRATTNAMKMFQAASIACVALSAATIVLEAKNMNDTLESLRAGSPCEKAQTLRQIKTEVDQLPATKIIADECESYLQATANKGNLY